MRALLAVGAFVAVLALAVLAAARWTAERPAQSPPAIAPSTGEEGPAAPRGGGVQPGVLYGRVTTADGATYEGRLRFGGDEEAFWGDYFNGAKAENPWAGHVPPEGLKESRPIEVFGLDLGDWEHDLDLERPFMTRFGDVARIEAEGRDLRVTLKSGTVFHLDRYGADDFADGVRVWDGEHGVVDLDESRVRAIELLPAPRSTTRSTTTPERLHGTVVTDRGHFTGFIQWSRDHYTGSDELVVQTADGPLRLRFDTVRSIECRSPEELLVALHDGREIAALDSREVGPGNLGIYVHDRRYGRVLVPWDALEWADFGPGGTGPAYGDFPPGEPLSGSVTARSGRRLAGRLVYDLDESETTETLDAPARNLDYTIPFGLVASIELPDLEQRGGGRRARLTLHTGEELQLDLARDLGGGHGGVLVFADGRGDPEHVRWIDVARIDLDRPSAMYPPLVDSSGDGGPGAGRAGTERTTDDP